MNCKGSRRGLKINRENVNIHLKTIRNTYYIYAGTSSDKKEALTTRKVSKRKEIVMIDNPNRVLLSSVQHEHRELVVLKKKKKVT